VMKMNIMNFAMSFVMLVQPYNASVHRPRGTSDPL
jgi:hypothetical protein